ncbi:MAG: hypothetical protein JO299_03315 [Gammaproteobacteria bacterium]|nr:hypothetical protein [Gammaproteobacteria bacterium]
MNVALWWLCAVAVTRGHGSIPREIDAASHLQLLLSAGYVAGCAYRSFLPVIDIPRIVLVDSRVSSVLIGRSVATVAELCFAAQWALVLHRAAALVGSPLVLAVSLTLVPLILLAELCSWYAVLTTGQRAHAAENSLWGLAAALAVASMFVIGPQHLPALYIPVIAGGVAYVAFIFFYDVPMYWSRWRVDQANDHKQLSIADGMADVCRRWVVSYHWDHWRSEIPWMSLYFTFGVWSSIWLVYASLSFGHGN